MPDPATPASCQNPELVELFLRKVRGTVPLTIQQIDIIVQLIAAAIKTPRSFLDLGCGHVVVSAAIF